MCVQKAMSQDFSFSKGTKVGLLLGEEQQQQSSSLQRAHKGKRERIQEKKFPIKMVLGVKNI